MRNRQPRGHAPGTFAAKDSSESVAAKLILFDIDGTLVLTGGAGVRAMALAFDELFSVSDAFRDVPMAGRTDTGILTSAAAAHGIPVDSPALARFPELYLKYLTRELDKPGPRK